MKRIHILTGLTLALAIAAHGQVSNPSIIPVTSDPTGVACTGGLPNEQYQGTMFTCKGGVWTASGTVSTSAYAPQSLVSYGDSITAGAGLTTASNLYVTRMATALGIPSASVTNRAISGSMACDVDQTQVFAHDAPAATANGPLRSLMIGTNEADLKGAGPYEATFNLCQQATLAWLGIPSTAKVNGSTATTTGTCTSPYIYGVASGVQCTANGSTASLSITTTGKPIYIWYLSEDGNTGTFTYAIDGGSTTSVNTAATTPIATANGATSAAALIRVSIAAGAHTVNFAQTNAGHMTILALGSAPSTLLKTALPVLVGQVPYELNDTKSTDTAAYNTDVQSNVSLLQGDGLNLFLASVRLYQQATTAAADMFDTLHPNDIGHAELETAFMGGLTIFPSNAVLASIVAGHANQTITTAASYTIQNSDQVVYSFTGNSTVVFPLGTSACIGQIVYYYNLTAGTVTISNSSPVNNMPTSIAPNQSFIAECGGVGNWFQIVNSIPSLATTATTATNALGMNATTQVKTANYTTVSTDTLVFDTNGSTVTIGSAPAGGRLLVIFNFSTTQSLTLAGTQNNIPTSLAPQTGITLFASSAGNWWAIGSSTFPVSTTITGTSGNASCSESLQGTLKVATCFLNGYVQTGAAQTYTYPTAFNSLSLLQGTTTGGTSCGTYAPTTTTTVLTLPANAAMTAETCSITLIGQ